MDGRSVIVGRRKGGWLVDACVGGWAGGKKGSRWREGVEGGQGSSARDEEENTRKSEAGVTGCVVMKAFKGRHHQRA